MENLEEALGGIRRKIAAADRSLAAIERTRDEHAFNAINGDVEAKAALDRLADQKSQIEDERALLRGAERDAGRRIEEAEVQAKRRLKISNVARTRDAIGIVRDRACFVDETASAFVAGMAAYEVALLEVAAIGVVQPSMAHLTGHLATVSALTAAGVHPSFVNGATAYGSLSKMVADHLRLSGPDQALLDADEE